MNSDHLLTASEAAHWLGVSPSVLTRLTNNEVLPHMSVGARKAYTQDDLENYLNKYDLIRSPIDKPRKTDSIPEVTTISFFSGAGGLDLGLEDAGIPTLLYSENNKECRMTLMRNRPASALLGDINEITDDKIWEYSRVPKDRGIDIMVGGPPCQAFSTAGARRAFDDKRGNVFLKYLSLAADLKPKYLVIENVRGLLSTPFPLAPGGTPVRGGALSLILSKLHEMNYGVSFNLYNAANFGAAQLRERVILIAKRDGSKASYLTPTHSDKQIWGLPKWRSFNEATAELSNTTHTHTQFPEKRLRYFRQLKEGQYWTSLPREDQKAAMGKAYDLTGGRTGFYRRIDGNRPAPTLVTSPTMPATDLCHPTELRPLSVEEYKAIQGFPDSWWIAGSTTEKYKQIGNAVPVSLGKAIGDLIIRDMNGETETQLDFSSFPYSRYTKTSDQSWIDPKHSGS